MAMLIWVMVGLAIWHFTIFLPDHFWGGIVGAFLGACVGAAIFGLIISGFHVAGAHDTDLLTAVESIPGAIAGIAVAYFVGLRQERAEAATVRPRH